MVELMRDAQAGDHPPIVVHCRSTLWHTQFCGFSVVLVIMNVVGWSCCVCVCMFVHVFLLVCCFLCLFAYVAVELYCSVVLYI